MKIISLSLLLLVSFATIAKEIKKPKYKSGKRIDFKALLIEGEKKKADFSVVTGNVGEQDFGLLKMKEDFYSEMKTDIKEDVQ